MPNDAPACAGYGGGMYGSSMYGGGMYGGGMYGGGMYGPGPMGERPVGHVAARAVSAAMRLISRHMLAVWSCPCPTARVLDLTMA